MQTAFGADCDTAELYVKAVNMDETVGVRHVSRAVVTNTAHAEYIFDFMATRTDLQNVQERWTVTHFTDAQGVYTQRLEVDGAERYTITYADASTNPRITLWAVALTAQVDVLNACADADLPLFTALAAQTSSDRTVVAHVIGVVSSALQPAPPFDDCWQTTCTPQPEGCQDLDPGQDCPQVYVCCVLACQYSKCVAQCWCQFGGGPDPPDDCCAEQEAIYYGCVSSCFAGMIECVEDLDC